MADDWQLCVMKGLEIIGGLAMKKEGASGGTAQNMQEMMALLPTSSPTSPVRKKSGSKKKGKKRAAASSSPSNSPPRSPAKKKKTKKQQIEQKQARAKAEAEAKAQAKAERPVNAWIMFGKTCTILGYHDMIPDNIVKANTVAQQSEGKRFNDAMSRTNLLKKILSAIFKSDKATVLALHARACDEGEGVEDDNTLISKQDCDRIVTKEWLEKVRDEDASPFRALFDAVENACKTGFSLEEDAEEDAEDVEKDDAEQQQVSDNDSDDSGDSDASE